MDNNYRLFKNIHLNIKEPTANGKSYFVKGDYEYFHYRCDGYDDVGWGCAYRTLQSICSWIINNQRNVERHLLATPSILQIQQTLVDISDKPESFYGSCEWIGALEVFYVIDTLYNVSCKIQHIPKCSDIKKYINILKYHFEEYGSMVMMGGDIDSSSKGIVGIHIWENEAYLLIVDPHFIGIPKWEDEIISNNYIRWQHTSEFFEDSFYNLCLPQLKFKNC